MGKALEKDRTRRYASAAGMAADLQRYLKDEPIAARPPVRAISYGSSRGGTKHWSAESRRYLLFWLPALLPLYGMRRE